jgi:hypothetical protein
MEALSYRQNLSDFPYGPVLRLSIFMFYVCHFSFDTNTEQELKELRLMEMKLAAAGLLCWA